MTSSAKSVKALNNDIKPGAGNSRHHGNRYYANLVDRNKKAFVLADPKGKDQVVKKIYNEIQQMEPPGRFLEKSKDGSYSVKDKDAALKKVKRALSENNKVMIENMRNNGQMPCPTKRQQFLRPCQNSKGKAGRQKPPKNKHSQNNEVTDADWDKLCDLLLEPETIPRKKHRNRAMAIEEPTLITEPQEKDVMLGSAFFSHPGSKAFLSLIKENKKAYTLAKNVAEEADIVKKVFDQIKLQSPQGRFIKMKREILVVCSKSDSLIVIDKALSENKDVILQYLNKEKKSLGHPQSLGRGPKIMPHNALIKEKDDEKEISMRLVRTRSKHNFS